MRELINDPFYATIREYDRCVVDYCLMADEVSYQGEESHRTAVLFAMLKLIERDIAFRHESEQRWGEVAGTYPWAFDIGKAAAAPIDPAEFLFVPEVLRIDRNGNVFYDSDWEPNDANCGGQIPYWYAFLEPPHSTRCGPEDLRRVNAALFPAGTDALEVYQWTTDWSNYFDAGHEWWGAACWSVYDRRMDRYAVVLASATD